MQGSRLGIVLLGAVLGTASLAAVGCGSDDSSSGAAVTGATGSSSTPAQQTGGVSYDKTLAASVPQAIRSKRTLNVATDATYPPNEFIDKDGKTIVGLDADLARDLGTILGLKLQLHNTPFDGIIPGLAAKKYDLGMSSFYITEERKKVVDMVSYMASPTTLFAASDGGANIASLADLCGKTVAVQKATTYADDANAQSKKCKAAGKPGVKVSVFIDQNGANLAIKSGRADVGINDAGVAGYLVKQTNGQFKTLGKSYHPQLIGLAVPRGNGLAKPLSDAFNKLMKSGAYAAALERWGSKELGVQSSSVNPPVE
jgi:polar amino acid transport system substrate-binding protein